MRQIEVYPIEYGCCIEGCEHRGAYVLHTLTTYHNDVANVKGNATLICPTCLDEFYPRCTECGQREYARRMKEGLCEECFDHTYVECDDCGEVLRCGGDEDNYDTVRNLVLCNFCWEEREKEKIDD